MIVKQRGNTTAWAVYHSQGNNPANVFYELNTTSGGITASTVFGSNPTSTVFGIGTDTNTNASSGTYIAYCFHDVEGYSRFGSYTGNGSTDGTFVYTGFRPAWVMVKATSQADHWNILDVKRDTFNVMDTRLLANNSTGEQTSSSYNVDFTSNGFKFRTSDVGWNGNNVSYIYMSFAENPFKYSLGR